MNIRKNCRLAMLLAAVLLFTQMPFTVYALDTSTIDMQVSGPEDGIVRLGQTHTISVDIVSPTYTFAGNIQWEVVGGVSGTEIINPGPVNISVTTPQALGAAPAQLRIANNEQAQSLTVRATLRVPIEGGGEWSQIREITLNVYRGGITLAREDDRGRDVPIGSSYDFGNRLPGYRALSPLFVSIFNHGGASTGELTVRLTGSDSNSFTLRGGTGSDTQRILTSIGANSDRGEAFSVVPRTGLASRSTPYTATVTVTGNRISESFTVRFGVGDTFDSETYTLTLRAPSGGQISLDGRSYGATQTGEFVYGERVSISARPNRDFYFDGWSYNHGEITNAWREETTFIMPDRNVTVWAQFVHASDWGWGASNLPPHAPFPSAPVGPPAALPSAPAIQPPALPPVQMPSLAPEPDPVPFEPVITPLSVNINGVPLSFSGQPSVMANGVSLIPIGELFRELGYTVEWDSGAREATLTRNNIVMVITEGSRSFTLNGMSRNLRAPAVIINDHLMVPFVEIIESVGGRTHLDTNNTVNIFITR